MPIFAYNHLLLFIFELFPALAEVKPCLYAMHIPPCWRKTGWRVHQSHVEIWAGHNKKAPSSLPLQDDLYNLQVQVIAEKSFQ